MGQKVHPYGFRLGFNKTWRSRWFADKDYAKLLHEDIKLRDELKTRFAHAGVSRIDIERAANKLKIDIHTSRPGIIIGRKGTEVDKLRQELQKTTGREVFINILEIQKPELDAQLIGESVAMQLEKRVAFRRAMRKAVESALRFGARGIKVRVSGRLNGAEIARSEWYLHGQLPLQTLRADIDYGFAEAFTTYGTIGVKVWLYKGERLTPQRRPRRRIPAAAARGGRTGGRVETRSRRAIDRASKRFDDEIDSGFMLMPKKVKYRKQQRGRMRGLAWRGSHGRVRRLRADVARAVLADRPADRSGARGADARHQARRQGLDSRVSGQAGHQEAAGNAHGQGQGRARGLGRRHQAGPHPVRDGRRDDARGAGGDAAGVGEAADEDAVRDALRRGDDCHEGASSC